MDFYDLQENDHRLLQQIMGSTTVNQEEYKEYLKRHFFDFKKLQGKKCILIAEEDPRVQKLMQTLIQDENPHCICLFADSVEEVVDVLEEVDCQLLIANYYLSEDEVDYEFWERIRARYPEMDVIILSHVNDREYYDLLEKLEDGGEAQYKEELSSRLKKFLGNVFGGWYGNH